jgi:hydrogenase maturation protease
MNACPRAPVIVIGVGNALRHDDAAGLEVARLLRERAAAEGIEVHAEEGEAVALLDVWEGAGAVVLVDAMRSGAAPGTIHRVDATSEPIPAQLRGSSSTHVLGIDEAIELARALGRLPGRVILYGVEGRRFGAGIGLCDEVQAVTGPLAGTVLREALELAAASATS